jgi:MFS family permease
MIAARRAWSADPASAEDGVRFTRGLPPPLVPLAWAMPLVEATGGAYLGILPLWMVRLGAPIPVVGLLLGAAGALRLAALAPTAAIAARLGDRRTLLACRAATALGLLSAAAATHWPQLVGLLVGGALGELVFPLAQARVATQSEGERLRAFALIFTVGPAVALAVAPLVAGGLVARWGMRAAFVFAAACSAGSLPFLARLPADVPSPRTARPASSYRAAVADPGFRLVAPLLLLALFALSLGTAFVPTFLDEVRGLEPATIAALSAASAGGTAAFGLAVARLRRLQGAPLVGVAAAVAVTAAGIGLVRSSAAIGLLVVAFACRGGLAAMWAMLDAILGELAAPAHLTRAFALTEMIGGIGMALGPLVAGPLYAWRPTLPFDAGMVLALGLVPVVLLAQRRADRLRPAG